MLIRKDKPSAKDYLKTHLESPSDLELLTYFDQYTLEAVILNVLGMVFNSLQEYSAVRVATLLDRLDSAVRFQAALFKSQKQSSTNNNQPSNDEAPLKEEEVSEEKSEDKGKKVVKRGSKKWEMYAIGANLVSFLQERNWISLSRELNLNDYKKMKKTKGGKSTYILNLYAMCNFDLTLLPIKLNIPMVCKPVPWATFVEDPSTISDIHGGYLSQPTGDIYHRYRLLTSHDYSHFYIKLGPEYKILLDVMNVLQSQPFEINKEALSFYQNNRDQLVKSGLLMPSFLASLNLKKASDIMRKAYSEDESIKNVASFPSLLKTLIQRIQRARSESFILTLASAYDGYKLYLPAFLDFRGRIYRSGILHFHERDLARSLIVFSNTSKDDSVFKEENSYVEARTVLANAASFHYKSFVSLSDSTKWYIENRNVFNTSTESLIQFAQEAKHPFQFISNVLSIEGEADLSTIPVTQDASSPQVLIK